MVVDRATYYRNQRILTALDRLEEAAAVHQRDRIQNPIIKRTAGRVRTIFRTQEREFMRRLDALARHLGVIESARLQEAGMPDWDAQWLQTVLFTQAAWEALLKDTYGLSFTAGGNALFQQFDLNLSFGLEHPRAAAYADEHAAAQVTRINNTTREQMRRIIHQGVDEGQSYGQIAQRLRENFRDMRTPKPQLHIRDRAEGIAVYEVGDSYEAGNEGAAREMAAYGLEMQKSWLTVGDNRVREAHLENQGEGWIPTNREFSSGHMRPPTDLGCRCTLLHRVKPEEEVG